MLSNFCRVLWFFVAILAVCSFGSAQGVGGTFSASVEVVDVTGAAIYATEVKFVELSTKVESLYAVDQDGKTTAALEPGAYTVTVTSRGFRSMNQRLEATAGGKRELKFVLQVGTGGGVQVENAERFILPTPKEELPFEVEISPEELLARTGEMLPLKVIVKNATDHVVLFQALPLEDVRNPFHIEVRDDENQVVPFRSPPNLSSSPKPQELLTGIQGAFGMRPGAANTFGVDLHKTFVLDRPGKYTVQAKLVLQSVAPVESNKIVLTIRGN